MSAPAVNLPTVAEAALPQRYEAARVAIAECERIDECKTWSDKAAALASYARQAKDDSLRVMAVRIQARAERRAGELLKQFPDGRETTQYGQVGSVPTVTRVQAATKAGLSERQRKTVLRVARVPQQEFERQVESPNPPTLHQLAEQGRLCRVSELDPIAERFKAACQALHQFTTFCDSHDPAETARTFGIEDLEMARRCVATLDIWLDSFVSQLGATT